MSDASDLWVSESLPLVQECLTLGEQRALESFRVPASPAFYLDVLHSLETNDVDEALVAHYRPTDDASDVLAKIAETFEEDERMRQPGIVNQLILVDLEWPWRTLTGYDAAVVMEEGKDAGIQGQALRQLAHAVLAKSLPETKDDLDQLIAEGYLFNYLHVAPDQSLKALAAILLLLRADEVVIGDNRPANAAAGEQFWNQLLANYAGREELVNMAAEAQDLASSTRMMELVVWLDGNGREQEAGLLGTVLDHFLGREGNSLPTDVVVAYYSFTEAYLAEEVLETVLDRASEDGSLEAEVVGSDFEEADVGLYQWMLDRGDPSPAITEFVGTGLTKAPRATWEGEFAQPSETLGLVERARDLGIETLGIAFSDALVDYAVKIARGEQTPDENMSQRLTALPKAMDTTTRRRFYRDLRSRLCDEAGNDLSAALSAFGEGLITAEVLGMKEGTDKLIDRVFRESLERRTPVEIAWMRRALESDESILKNARKDTVATFRARVREIIDAGGAGEDLEAVSELVAK